MKDKIQATHNEQPDTVWNGGYQKSEIIQIIETINDKKQELNRLQFELQDEEFHFKHIPERSNRVEKRLLFHLPYYLLWIPLYLGFLISFVFVFFCAGIVDDDGVNAAIGPAIITLILGLVVIRFSPIFFENFLIPDLKDFSLIWKSRNTKSGKRNAIAKEVYSFQLDLEHSQTKIDFLKNTIQKLKNEIKELEDKQKSILENNKRNSSDLINPWDVPEGKNDSSENTSKFAIRQDTLYTSSYMEMLHFFTGEEKIVLDSIKEKEIEIQSNNYNSFEIRDKMQNAKFVVILFIIIFVSLIFLQRVVPDSVQTAITILCIFLSTAMFFTFDKLYSKVILDYLIEIDSEFVLKYKMSKNIISYNDANDTLIREKMLLEERLEDIMRQKKDISDMLENMKKE